MSDITSELARIKYPHMVPEEITIWKRFLKKHGSKFDKFRYDVHVGKGIGPVPGYNKKYQDMYIRITQKRIDVVAYRRRAAFIIEIKDRAGMSAIGQLLSYRKLYMEKHHIIIPPGMAIVAESIDNDVRGVAEGLGIQITLV